MGNILIKAPKVLCVYQDDTTLHTYELLSQIQRSVLQKNQLVTLDLSGVEWITAGASVLLFATINTCQLMTDNPNVIRCNFPKQSQNEMGYRCIVKTGLSRALCAGTLEKLEELTSQCKYFQSSTTPDSILGPTLSLLTERTKLSESQLDLLLAGIAEAMLNVKHHAYKHPAYPPLHERIDPRKESFVQKVGERWWQCAWYNPSNKAWTFIICDLGLGIAETYNYLRGTDLNKAVPSSAIEQAFIVGNSRFVGLGRGNGSDDMKRPIEHGAREQLLVYSEGTKYLYETGNVAPTITNFKSRLTGTLVQWTLYAEEARE
ncbi:hypothetical protein [Vibrio crassostreae]|uniref:hypothetical protein n=1 Tax=Vibrio crassostreae TaxID=246167 RepID=UPI004067D28C